MRLGIDFGTTRTVVAVCDRGNFPVLDFGAPDGETLGWYPSAAACRDGEWVFGAEALTRRQQPGWGFVRSFKRLLARAEATPDQQVRVGDERVTIVSLITAFLSALREAILHESNLPIDCDPDEVMEAVIASPANAHSTQRFVILEAFRRAGFEVVAMLNEPSAAGVEYAHRFKRTLNSKRQQILVYDLGGGTFDASLVDMSGQSHDIVNSKGLARLGGDDFDNMLLEVACAKVGLDSAQLPEGTRQGLLEHCREQKEALHPNTRRIVIELGALLDEETRRAHGGSLDEDAVVTLETEVFYESCRAFVEQTMEVFARVLPSTSPLFEEEEGAEIDMSRVAGVYVVGGASALPVVARTLRSVYKRRVHRSSYPSASIAIGLAIAHDDRSSFRITERLNRHFGIFREADGGATVRFDPIFSGAQELPRLGQRHELVRTYRPVHDIGHLRYIECGWIDEDGTPSGDVSPVADILFAYDHGLRDQEDLRQVPVRRMRRPGPLIEERYSVDAAGVIEFTITDLESGYQMRHRFGAAEPSSHPVVRSLAPAPGPTMDLTSHAAPRRTG